jgi:hypothetical protein
MNYYVTDSPPKLINNVLSKKDHEEVRTSLLLIEKCKVYDRMIILSMEIYITKWEDTIYEI